MKIESILNVNFNVQNSKKQNFKGYVNGKYYEDHIIDMAKKALKDSNWERNFRKERSGLNSYLNWHEEIKEQGGATTRILAAGLSFGLSEVFMGGLCAIGSALDNTDEIVNKVKNCMNDLLKKS